MSDGRLQRGCFKIEAPVTEAMRHKLKHRRFHLNMRKHFTVEVAEYSNWLQERLGSFTLWRYSKAVWPQC